MNTSLVFKSIKTTKNFFAVIFVFLMVGVGNVIGATKTWVPTIGGAWALGTNWSPSGAPAAGDDVIINSDQSANITAVPAISLTSLTINGSCSFFAGAGGNLITITGTFSVAAGKTLSGGTAGTTRLNYLLDTFAAGTIAGTFTIPGTGRSFTNNGNLTITASGLINGNVFILSSGATLQIGSPNGITTVGTASGNIQTSTTRTYNAGANYVYNGIANQATGTGLPTNLTGKLTINNSGNTVTLNSAEAVANGGSIDLVAGVFATGTNLTLNAATSTINRSEGSMTGAIQGASASTYNVNYTGNSKTTSTELSGAGLNNITVNLTSGQTLTLDQNRAPNGDVTINTGSNFDLSTYTLNRSAVGGTLTVAGTMQLGGTSGGQTGSNFPTNFSTLTMTGGTVNYDNATGGQTIYSNPTYNNLTAGNTSGTQTAGGNLTVNGTLTTTSGGTLNMATYQLLGSLTTITNGGIIRTQNTTTTPIPTGKTWGGTVQYDAATGGQTVMAGTYNNLTLGNTSGTQTANGALTINGTLTSTAGGTLNMGTNQLLGSLTTITNGGIIRTQNTTTTPIPTGKTWGGTVTFDASTAQTIPSSTFNNLILSNTGGASLGGVTIVNGTLTLTSGQLTLGAYNLIIAGSAAVAGTPSATNMIVTNGIGELRKTFTANGSYVFPVGDNTNTVEYSPITLNFVSGSYSSAYAGVKVTNAKHPNNEGSTNYLSRYWSVNQSGITGFSCTVTATYLNVDVTGTVGNLTGAEYTGALPWIKYTTLSANTLTATGVSSFGDFTGIPTPVVTVSPTTLSSFTYPFGFGPSITQTFNVNGVDLTANITVVPASSHEISLTDAPSFVAQSIIILNVGSGTISATTIYVRLKAGLAVGSYTGAYEKIVCESSGATLKTVACSGSVSNSPTITVSPTPLTLFSYNLGAGPSAYQTFTVSGAYLTNNIILTPPTNFEISTSSSSGYVTNPTTLLLTQVGGNVATTTIYVRLKAGVGAGTYAPANITLTSTGALSQNVACTAIVNAPTINVYSQGFLKGFIYSGTGPSGSQSFTVDAINLITDLTVTAPTNFEICETLGGTYVSSLAFTPSSGTVTTKTIYVRLKASLAVATYPAVGTSNVIMSSTGAISLNVAVSGSVVSIRTILVSKSSITGFTYLYTSGAGGPSIEQSFTVSGAVLTASIVITPPTNFLISLTSGIGFQSTPITLTNATTVNPTTIYVKLAPNLAINTYSGNIGCVSSATTVNVACSGKVIADPTIAISNGAIISTCDGSALTLTSTGTATDKYWEGPNGTYSKTDNWNLGNVTYSPVNMSGTYTVTGSALSGVNLVTNGDFETTTGDLGFGSSYTYVVPSSTALSSGGPTGGGETLYTITNPSFPTPDKLHSSFSNCVDHSPAGLYQMVVNAAGTAGVVIWSQSIAVVPNANYHFSYYVQSVYPLSPSQLQLYVNGVSAGPVYTADLGTCAWKQFTYDLNVRSNTMANLTLINQNTALSGNDFALDDISFQQSFPVSASTVLTVNPNLPVSVSIAASANPLYTGIPVTVTATPTNGGTSPSYQWKVNGSNVGTNSPTYSYTPATAGDALTCVMTSNASCISSGNPATSNTLTAVASLNYWMGSIGVNGTNWSISSNWTANAVPLSGKDVVYATVANWGTAAVNDLQLDVDRTIGSLINLTNKALIIPAGKGLIVNNSITTDNNVDRIIIKSTTNALPLVPNGSLTFHNSQSMPVYATVEMYSKANWDATGVKDLNTLIWYHYNWQYFGIPLTTLKASPTLDGSYIRRWDETGNSITNHWLSINNDYYLEPFKGYEITQQLTTGKNIVFQGQLVNSDFSSANPLTITGNALFQGQYVFANPYTAAINITQLSFGEGAQKTVYLYNTGSFAAWYNIGGSSTSGVNPGQYVSVPYNLAGTPGLPLQIPSMGAMLIQPVSTGSNVNYNFSVIYNNVVINNTDAQRAPQVDGVSSSDKVGIIIDVKGEHAADRMWIFSEPNSTRGFDNGWDGQKMLGSALTPQLFAMEADGNYQVNSVPDMNNTELGFQAGQDLEYTLTFTHENIKKQYAGLYLVDLVENKTIDITVSGSTYAFVAESTPAPVKRFKIVTRPYEKDAPDTETQVKIFSSQGSIFVQNYSDQDGECMVYDIAGHNIMKVPFTANGVTAITNSLRPGAYIATAMVGAEKVSKRLIVR